MLRTTTADEHPKNGGQSSSIFSTVFRCADLGTCGCYEFNLHESTHFEQKYSVCAVALWETRAMFVLGAGFLDVATLPAHGVRCA